MDVNCNHGHQTQQTEAVRKSLLQAHYAPVSSAQKLNLILHRSFRYSYRQRCCRCCPNIVYELLFPIIAIILLVLIRYGINRSAETEIQMVSDYTNLPCSLDIDVPPTTSADVFTRCFKFPPSYINGFQNINYFNHVSNRTNIVFEPYRADINELAEYAYARLTAMKCENTNVWTQNPNDKTDSRLLQNQNANTVIIDFTQTANIRTDRTIIYNIIVRTPNTALNNNPVDRSFILFKHPSCISDRSNSSDYAGIYDSSLPEFSDVKMFVDSLLMQYQTNRSIQYQLQRSPMTCAPFRNDHIFTSGINIVGIILALIDMIFFIPYFVLLTNLMHDKTTKVKEILKVLGIQPLFNNIAQAIRTMIILFICILILCILYKLKLGSDAYFNRVNFTTLLFGNMIYALQLVSFCVMNAQFFDTKARATTFTVLLYIVPANTYSFVLSCPPGLQYVLMMICPYFGKYSLFQQFVLHDLANKDVAYVRAIYRSIPVYLPTLLIMVLSSCIYWGLSWYFEKVFPGEYGIPRPWNFLFKREYWHTNATKSDIHSYDNPVLSSSIRGTPLVRAAANGAPIVRVEHLVKKFGPDKIAVNDVSFDLYENQITSILGPNGSGKTTIFNCLIGIYKQTSGTITIESENGLDLDTTTKIDLIRKSVGYCPQHDILFDLLTVEEQLQFYASARGYGQCKQYISDKMLELVNLESSKNVYCRSLSGGMKRRLSLACAFVGDTKIVLLDEPSSGLDPSSRRLLWDWLRTMKEGKTLLLTTHFMEESDALSDRILIISNGVLKVDGSSSKLKEQYGSGYKLIINKQTGYGSNEISGELRSHLPSLTIETDDVDGDVVIRANQQPNDGFVRALRHLEQMKEENRIKNYGIQNSTMDDVFLKITKEKTESDDPNAMTLNMERIDEQCRCVFEDKEFFDGWRYFLSQIYGLTMKTLLVRYRRRGLMMFVLLIPIVYNLLSNILSQSENATGTFKMKTAALNPQTILYRADPVMEKYFLETVVSKTNDLVLNKRTDNISQMNRDILEKRKANPFVYTDIYLGFDVPAPEGDTYKIHTLSSNLISGHEVISVASNIFFKHILNDTNAKIQTTLLYKKTGKLTIEPTLSYLMNSLSIWSCYLKIVPTNLIIDVCIFYMIFSYTAIFLVGEGKGGLLSLLNISGLQYEKSRWHVFDNLISNFSPKRLRTWMKDCFLPNPALYWLFTYVFDIITSVIWFSYLLALYCLLDVAFNGTSSSQTTSNIIPMEFTSSWNLRVHFYPLTIIIVLPTFPFVYLLTKMFKTDILCGLGVSFILTIMHFTSTIVPIFLFYVSSKSTQIVAYWLLNIVSPTTNAQTIIVYLLVQKSKFCRRNMFTDVSFFNPIGNETIGWNWFILILHTVLLLLLLIAIDSGLLKFSFSFSFLTKSTSSRETALDNDVRDEQRRILGREYAKTNKSLLNSETSEGTNEADHLTIHDLVKRFSRRNVLAVNHLTFGARRGEAFGLLGYNGAGKTTTFRILVGQELATKGTAYIDGENVRRRFKSLRQLGYCPQENCNLDFLTVQDSLYLFARTRGVTLSRIDFVVRTIGSLFLLDPFLQNYVHQLSGGTKRRLQTALAFIGPPLVAILDEPTTGVDPNARQQMQEIFLNAVKAKLTVILTSHSMDECERVCNRLGIMANGQLACLGTIQHLKSKFGEGYTIEVKVRSSPSDESVSPMSNVESMLLSKKEWSVEVKEMDCWTGTFQVKQALPAELFELIEEHKEQLNIETYSISQTTLEQIFLSLGKRLNSAELQVV